MFLLEWLKALDNILDSYGTLALVVGFIATWWFNGQQKQQIQKQLKEYKDEHIANENNISRNKEIDLVTYKKKHNLYSDFIRTVVELDLIYDPKRTPQHTKTHEDEAYNSYLDTLNRSQRKLKQTVLELSIIAPADIVAKAIILHMSIIKQSEENVSEDRNISQNIKNVTEAMRSDLGYNVEGNIDWGKFSKLEPRIADKKQPKA